MSNGKEPGFLARVWGTQGGKWAVAGLIFFAAVAVVSLLNPSRKNNSSSSMAFDASDALVICQSAIKLASKDAEKAKVPYVPNQGSDGGYFFAWNNTTKLARLRNGLGLEVGVTALCKVDAATRRITSLTLDGRQLI